MRGSFHNIFKLRITKMENKREFKKSVEAVGASVVEQMMFVYYNVKGVDKDAIERSIARVLGATAAAKSNANVFFDKGSKAFENRLDYTKAKRQFFKALFKKISGEFSAEVNGALSEFNAALPEDVKKQNIEAVK